MSEGIEESRYLLAKVGDEMGEVGLSQDDLERFEQHDDPDVVIPDKIARPLLFSAHFFLIVAIIAACYGRNGLFGVILFLYFTSVWHWSRPRFSSLARKIDYIAVLISIVYASYVSTTLPTIFILVWFCGIAIIGCIFITNEYLFYIQVMKTVSGESTEVDIEQSLTDQQDSWKTEPFTPERDFVYKRTAWVHCICVHGFAAALALTIIIASGPVN